MFLNNNFFSVLILILEIVLLAVTLSLDAFSVALSKGMTIKKYSFKHSLSCGLWFGFFQALMPLIGYFAFKLLSDNVSWIEKLDHWLAFIALGFIGGKMIYESFKDEDNNNSSFAIKVMFGMAIATSIDALAAGIPLATDNQNIWINIACIGIITFLFSYFGTFLGFKVGSLLKEKLGNKVEIIGGIILILLGLKILIEHLFF
jgi:putative Mn2+ efflux pump MntP